MKIARYAKKLSVLMLCSATALSAAAWAAPAETDARTLSALTVKAGVDARSPGAAVWKQAPVTQVNLQPAFPGHPAIVGTPATQQLTAQAVQAGDMLYVRLRWSDKTANAEVADTDRFLDRVAVQFPLSGEVTTTPFMGDGNNAVNIWHWRADGRTENLFAKGFGTATPVASKELTSSHARNSDGWDVVLARPLAVKSDEGVVLNGRKSVPVAFAAWDGDGQERDGFKAVTLEWWQLQF
jgi:dimethylsulfide dehydrogenase subunit gamma/complex iron-sulfur molybdoenzyme family reductase subunit gamma